MTCSPREGAGGRALRLIRVIARAYIGIRSEWIGGQLTVVHTGTGDPSQSAGGDGYWKRLTLGNCCSGECLASNIDGRIDFPIGRSSVGDTTSEYDEFPRPWKLHFTRNRT
jgi:hypothetical protein